MSTQQQPTKPASAGGTSSTEPVASSSGGCGGGGGGGANTPTTTTATSSPSSSGTPSAGGTANVTIDIQEPRVAGGATPDKALSPRTGGTTICQVSYALAAYLLAIAIAAIVLSWVLPCMSNTARIICTVISLFVLLGGIAALFWRWPAAAVL